jgi:hypothetical protein
MIPVTRHDILFHQSIVPWSAQHQVEQDLLLCRVMAALFDDSFLSTESLLRNGISYDPQTAGKYVIANLLRRLPE